MCRVLCVVAAAALAVGQTQAFTAMTPLRATGTTGCRSTSRSSGRGGMKMQIGGESDAMEDGFVPNEPTNAGQFDTARPYGGGQFPGSLLSSANDVLADLEELDSVLSDDRNDVDLEPRQPYLNHLAVQAAKRRWQRHENDQGSPEVQIAVQTERISYLTQHMLKNKGDKHNLRGLARLVQERKKHLTYLARENRPKAIEMAQALGIRFKPRSGRYLTSEEKYAKFKNVKSKEGVLIRTKIINREKAEAEAALAAQQE